jgi:hypothetical protein
MGSLWDQEQLIVVHLPNENINKTESLVGETEI